MTNARHLSVVIPLFNKRLTIERAVNSVLSQTHKTFDLIVVDDGSTDGSAESISSISDTRLRVIKQENSGVSMARNRGISEAKANYICLLDADDEWSPRHLEQIADLIKMNPEAGLYSCRYDVVSPSGEKVTRALSLPVTFRGEVPDFFDAYRKSRSLVNSSSACVRRECMDAIGGFPEGEPVGEDVYVWLRLAESYPVMFDARVSSTIHRDAPNRTTDRQKPAVPHYLHHFLNDRAVHDLPKALQKLLASFVMIYAADAVGRGDRSLPARYAKMVWPISAKTSSICFGLTFAPRGAIEALRRRKFRQ